MNDRLGDLVRLGLHGTGPASPRLARLNGLPDLGGIGLRAPVTSSPQLALLGLGARPVSVASEVIPKWVAVEWRFQTFHENVKLTGAQLEDGITKAQSVGRCLRSHYYGPDATQECGHFIGSWAKNTQVRPPRDVDVHFCVPYHVYGRFQQRIGNRQSALLQEVKDVLAVRYPTTDMSADGQVVIVGFGTFNVEVAPVVSLNNGRFWVCNTRGGGSYSEADPFAEATFLQAVDAECSGNLRPLIRMLKTWQRTCNVDIKSFHLELLAAEFLRGCAWRNNNYLWFDWIVRDFFAFLFGKANSHVTVPGTGEWMSLGGQWQTKALSAFLRASKACDFERDNMVVSAGQEWQKIFGADMPVKL